MSFSSTSVDAETRDLLALHLVPGLGPRLTKALLERFGSAGRVLQASAPELGGVPRIGDKIAQNLAQALRNVEVEREWELLEKHQVRLIRINTPEYPEPLATLADAPMLLYLRGELTPADRNAVGIVGSRHCTSYGRKIAERLAAGLVGAGFTVVSGLARGIDGIAHRAALAAGGRTIAVVAGGLARVYPPEHTDLAAEIAVKGAVLSEAPMGMAPMAEMFPARNRLISGLSKGVVIVEAADKSGALITARHAAEQGREVFAVPGPVDSPSSDGTLRLLKDGATLVRDVNDILSVWGRTAGPRGEPAAPAKPPANLPESQQKVLGALTGAGLPCDSLVQQTGLSVADVSDALGRLEMQGLVRRLPGNRFERK